MDRIKYYREVIQSVRREYAQLFNHQPAGVDVLAVCDEATDTYAIVNVGWDGNERLNTTSVLMRIVNGKSGWKKIEPCAAAAARGAGLAAASVYTYQLADVRQTKHIVGPVTNATLSLELDHASDPSIDDAEVGLTIKHVTSEVREVLPKMPVRQAGKS